MRITLACVLSLLTCLPASSQPQIAAKAAPFGQADLEALVGELDTVVPHNANYTYPMQIRLVESKLANAQTYYEERDGKKIPQVEMFTALVALAKGDRDILRAVLAHELSHLSLGHSLEHLRLADFDLAHTRQQEFEADEYGARYLKKLGHDPAEMVVVLKMLDQDMKDGGCYWLHAVASDHATPIARAARLTGDQELLAAVTRFELGLAYMDCRHYQEAIAFFDQSKAQSWNVFEADFNSASAALQDYYDRLPGAVQQEWLRPEFGPHLTDVVALRGRAIEITDADQKRYDQALLRIDKLSGVLHAPMANFLRGTAQVLDPKGEEAMIREGVKVLQEIADGKALGGWDAESVRLRAANNLALGLHRLHDDARAASALMAEQKRTPTLFLHAVGENLSRLPLAALDDNDATLAADVLFTYLLCTPVDAPGGRQAQRAIEDLEQKHSFKVNQPTRAPVLLCGVATMTIDSREVGLFQHFTKVSEILGSIPDAGPLNERFPDLQLLVWGDSDVIALMEKEQLIKLTSYRPKSSLELRPGRDSGLRTSYRITVGMTEAELDAVLAPAGGASALKPHTVKLLSRHLFTQPAPETPAADGKAQATAPVPQVDESWRYYPTLNFGVLIENGRVTGITVAPVG